MGGMNVRGLGGPTLAILQLEVPALAGEGIGDRVTSHGQKVDTGKLRRIDPADHSQTTRYLLPPRGSGAQGWRL
jgi:hypothetical protein